MASISSDNKAPTTAVAGPSSLPGRLNRERSQQDLEVAQQLIEHSQSVPARQSPESHTAKEYQQASQGVNGEASGHPVSPGDQGSSDGSPGYVQTYSSPQTVKPAERRASSNVTTPVGGQMCRYEEDVVMVRLGQ